MRLTRSKLIDLVNTPSYDWDNPQFCREKAAELARLRGPLRRELSAVLEASEGVNVADEILARALRSAAGVAGDGTGDSWAGDDPRGNIELSRADLVPAAEHVAELERALADVLRAYDRSTVENPALENAAIDGWEALGADPCRDLYERGRMADMYDKLRSDDPSLHGPWRPRVCN